MGRLRSPRGSSSSSNSCLIIHAAYFTVNQILSQAWAGPALLPEEVRNYVRRVQMILAELEIPCALVDQAGRGYSLELRVDN